MQFTTNAVSFHTSDFLSNMWKVKYMYVKLMFKLRVAILTCKQTAP